jgi:membrane-anchored protein YejM (alkaline phosphatase superfamily)
MRPQNRRLAIFSKYNYTNPWFDYAIFRFFEARQRTDAIQRDCAVMNRWAKKAVKCIKNIHP